MKLLIVGGVAGGASAATRSRRLSEDADIVLFERGPDVSFANCGLPYYVGGEIAERDKLLVTTPERLRTRFKLDVRTRSSVEAIDRSAKKVRVRDLTSGREYEETYDKLIFAGITDTCGMGMILARMPWNHCTQSAKSCCAR